MTTETTTRKPLSAEAVRACIDKAQATAREIDPRCERVTQLAPCQYAVIGRKGDRYTVTVTKAGFTCTCAGASHPACWHRATAMRFRIVQRWLKDSAAPVAAPASEPVKATKAPVPNLVAMYGDVR